MQKLVSTAQQAQRSPEPTSEFQEVAFPFQTAGLATTFFVPGQLVSLPKGHVLSLTLSVPSPTPAPAAVEKTDEQEDWDVLKRALDDDRLSDRKLFP
jgi:hypothetical protein